MLDVNRAIASNPHDWKAYRDRGWIYAHKHEFDRALADLDMALRLKPDDARAYTRRGHIWKAAGQRQKAIADYEAAMRLDPANECGRLSGHDPKGSGRREREYAHFGGEHA